jgi:hypothetical protein
MGEPLPAPARPIRIANVSGFLGDRFAALREMLAAPDPVDVITGDYLAELTMLILGKQQARDERAGYAAVFLRQLAESLGDCLDRGIKVVANAGGLNPRGLRDEILAVAAERGLRPSVAVVDGDDLRGRMAELQAAGVAFTHLDTGHALPPVTSSTTANAYLGGWGIAAALAAGADVVVCGRITDASLVVGPAAWWHGWRDDEWDALAGAVVAGHVIECGAQATGGNYPFLHELAPGLPGFPIAEVADDGTFVVTKQPGTGGAVSVGTVTAQLLYEVGGTAYPNPDVTAHFDGLVLEPAGTDRVAVRGARGTPPPDVLKVAVNLLGGYRNTMTMVITGLDIEDKARHATRQLLDAIEHLELAEIDVQLLRHDHPDAPTNPEATAHLRVTAKSPDRDAVGRAFSNEVTALTLQSYAGFFATTPPTAATEYGVYWPALVPRAAVDHTVLLPDGREERVPDPSCAPLLPPAVDGSRAESDHVADPDTDIDTVRVPLGRVCGARSGDKGGNANVGFWCATDDAYAWLRDALTVERLHALLPEAAALEIRRYEFASLRGLNFVIVGLLGEGVASSVRPDAQAKGLGEFLRSRTIDVPRRLLADD